MSKINYANLVTLFRLALVPVIIFLLTFEDFGPSFTKHLPVALFLFLIVWLGDWLDGYLARRFDQVTDLGKVADQITDKIAIISILVALTSLGEISFWPVLIIIWRELAVSGWRMHLAAKGIVVPADWWGKIKTALQGLAVLWLIGRWPGAEWLLWLAVIVTVLSGLEYFWTRKDG